MFQYINKSGTQFQDAIFIYIADFMAQEMVQDTYDYTKLIGLYKGKGSILDLNMTRYIHGKDLDAKFLEASLRKKETFITKNCPFIQIGGMKGNSSSEHLLVVKTWMKTNEVGETICIFEAFHIVK